MFENLSQKLAKTVQNLRGKGRISEDNIAETLREVRMALLEADVALPVIKTFLDTIDGGVIYVNRRVGATTGAWPMVQPFGGWKKSGTTGKSGGGLYYVQQYLREQSQTVVR